MDFRDRIQRDPNPLEQLVRAIPGFAGYLDREQRRGADKLLREYLAEEIDDAVQRLEKVATAWSKAGEIDSLDDLDQIAGRLRRAGDNLRYADYGYSGFFDLVKIEEEDLHRFYEYDMSLRSFIADIADAIDELAEAAGDDIEDAMIGVDEAIEALQEMVDERENVATDLVP